MILRCVCLLLVVGIVALSGCMGVSGRPLEDPPYPVEDGDIVGTWENGSAFIEFAPDGTFHAEAIPGKIWDYGGPSGSSIEAAGWWQGCDTRESQVRGCDVESGFVRLALSCDYFFDSIGNRSAGAEDGEVEPGCPRVELHFQDEELWLYMGMDPNEPQNEEYRFSKVAD